MHYPHVFSRSVKFLMLVLLYILVFSQFNLGTASAQSPKTFHYLFDISEVRDIVASHDGGANYFGTSAGRFHATLNGDPISIFCLDVTHSIAWGDTYMANVQYHVTDPVGGLSNDYYQGGLSSALVNGDFTTVSTREAQARSAQVAFLADAYMDAGADFFASGDSGNTDLRENLAGIQLALWDIIQDGNHSRDGDGAITGDFILADDTNARYGDLMNYYEGVAADQADYNSTTAFFLQNPTGPIGAHAQDFVFEQSTLGIEVFITPEPGPSAFLIGSGVIACIITRRRRTGH